MSVRGPRSLPEVHASVGTQQPSLWRRMFAFAGPAYLVSVGVQIFHKFWKIQYHFRVFVVRIV